MNDSLKDKLLENLKHLAKDALIHIEAYNYMAIFWTNWYLYIGIEKERVIPLNATWYETWVRSHFGRMRGCNGARGSA